jgi:hypothetical protein
LIRCTECNQPVKAKGLCSRHYQQHRTARLRTESKRTDKSLFDESRDFLNAFRGAESALKRLAQQNTGIDYSGALRECQERIAALSEVRS